MLSLNVGFFKTLNENLSSDIQQDLATEQDQSFELNHITHKMANQASFWLQ
jgi:hypothetical protein